MSAESALYGKLVATSGVTALVSTRIYPVQVPQDAAMPAVSYRRISTRPIHAHDGAQTVYLARFELTVQADSYGSMKAVLDALRAALDGIKNLVTGIHVARLDTERDDVFGDATNLYIGQQEYVLTVED